MRVRVILYSWTGYTAAWCVRCMSDVPSAWLLFSGACHLRQMQKTPVCQMHGWDVICSFGASGTYLNCLVYADMSDTWMLHQVHRYRASDAWLMRQMHGWCVKYTIDVSGACMMRLVHAWCGRCMYYEAGAYMDIVCDGWFAKCTYGWCIMRNCTSCCRNKCNECWPTIVVVYYNTNTLVMTTEKWWVKVSCTLCLMHFSLTSFLQLNFKKSIF